MSNIVEAYGAGVDAIIADNGTSRAAFVVILRTYSDNVSTTEWEDWVDSVATFYFSLNLSNNSNYNQLRNRIIDDGADVSKALFTALLVGVNSLPETLVVSNGIELQTLRAERDEVDTSITTMQGFRAGQTEQVIEALNIGIEYLRAAKQALRNQIEAITGDPDN